MQIRRAKESDTEGIERLLLQVCMVHHEGRPDLFKAGAKKYTRKQLAQILHDEERPVFAAVDESGCYNVTLNVWTCNESAMKFYESCGLKPQKIGMEVIL